MVKQIKVWVDNLPVRKKLLLLIGTLCANALWAIGFSVVVLDTLEGIRASVAMQNYWTDSATRCVFYIKNYAQYAKDSDYQAYLSSLNILKGFALANEEARKDRRAQDLEKMARGFAVTNTPSAEVDAVVDLISSFGRFPYVKEAIDAWSIGHDYVEKIDQLASHIRSSLLTSGSPPDGALARLNEFETVIDEYEEKFVREMARAARFAEFFFFWLTLMSSLLLFVISIFVVIYVNSRISTGIRAISSAAAQASEGKLDVRADYRSGDELGQLAASFNHMVQSLALLDQVRAKALENSRLTSLGEMAGGIAHEINNPLTIIRGQAEILTKAQEEGTITAEEVLKRARKILALTDRASGIIRGLRNFARDGSGEEPGWHSASEIISESVALCREQFSLQNVELSVSIDTDAHIYCRALQTSQVVVDLLNNARHAAAGSDLKQVEIGFHLRGDQAVIVVSDSGSGIPPALRQRIFEPFFTTKEIGQGTGLGLSVSKGLMEAQGGDLSLDTDSPRTRFVMTFRKWRP